MREIMHNIPVDLVTNLSSLQVFHKLLTVLNITRFLLILLHQSVHLLRMITLKIRSQAVMFEFYIGLSFF